MTKEELNKEIDKLSISLKAHKEQVNDLEYDLKVAEEKLADIDKPKLTEKQFDEFFNLIADVTSKLNSVFEEALTNHSEKPFEGLSKTHPSIAVLLIRKNLVQHLNDENKSNSERQKTNYLH